MKTRLLILLISLLPGTFLSAQPHIFEVYCYDEVCALIGKGKNRNDLAALQLKGKITSITETKSDTTYGEKRTLWVRHYKFSKKGVLLSEVFEDKDGISILTVYEYLQGRLRKKTVTFNMGESVSISVYQYDANGFLIDIKTNVEQPEGGYNHMERYRYCEVRHLIQNLENPDSVCNCPVDTAGNSRIDYIEGIDYVARIDDVENIQVCVQKQGKDTVVALLISYLEGNGNEGVWLDSSGRVFQVVTRQPPDAKYRRFIYNDQGLLVKYMTMNTEGWAPEDWAPEDIEYFYKLDSEYTYKFYKAGNWILMESDGSSARIERQIVYLR